MTTSGVGVIVLVITDDNNVMVGLIDVDLSINNEEQKETK